jgi:Icc-related predicted phosphoesterase
MGYVSLLVASDIHEDTYEPTEDSESFPKYRHLRELAKGRDAVVLHGDYWDENMEVLPVMRAKAKASARLGRWVDQNDERAVELYAAIKSHGGLDKIKESILDPGTPDALRTDLEAVVKMSVGRERELERIERKYGSLIAFNNRWTKADMADLKKELKDEMFYRLSALDNILGKIGCPVYGVRGNWETDYVVDHKWKNLKWLEKEGVVNVKGLRIAGAQNWYEAPAELALEGFYEKAEHDPAWGGNRGLADNEFEKSVVPDDMQFIDEGRIPPRFLENNEVWKRLNDKNFDVLFTHKGPHELVAEEKDGELKNYGSGIGLEGVIRKVKPSIIVAGHIHGKGKVFRTRLSNDYVYQAVRTSNEEFFDMKIDTSTKQIVDMTKYRWPDEVSFL